MTNEELMALAINVIKNRKGGLGDYLNQGLDPNSLFEDTPLLYWAVVQTADIGCYSTKESIEKDTKRIVNQVQLLLDSGANMGWTDEEGNTLLHVAEEYEVVKLLLSKGMNPHARNHKGVPCHNNDRYDSRGRVLAFFEAKVAVSYLALTDNPALNHPEIMDALLDYTLSGLYSQKNLDDALVRALDLPNWLPSAKILIKRGASLYKKSYFEELLPLEKCISKISILGAWYTMSEHEKDQFKKLDEAIVNHPYFQFAVYLYEYSAMTRITHYYQDNVFMPPLIRVNKDREYLPSRRVIEHLAPYEAKFLRVDTKIYKDAINLMINPPISTMGTIGNTCDYDMVKIRNITDRMDSPVLNGVKTDQCNSQDRFFHSVDHVRSEQRIKVRELLQGLEPFKGLLKPFWLTTPLVCTTMLTFHPDEDKQAIAAVVACLRGMDIKCFYEPSVFEPFISTGSIGDVCYYLNKHLKAGNASSVQLK